MAHAEFDESFDFVVVGSGGGSMCAGLVMREMEKSVLILEKTDLVGGTTARSGGVMWVPNNHLMKDEGVEDSFDKAAAHMEATAGQSLDAPGTTLERRRVYVTEAPRMLQFLARKGVRFRRPPLWPDYYDERDGGSIPGRTVIAELFDINELGEWKTRLRPNFLSVPLYHPEGFEIATHKSSWRGKAMMIKLGLRMIGSKLMGKSLVTAGAALQGRMLLASLQAGVDIRINSAVKSLIVKGGAVSGVVTERDGREWRIEARLGVLVNAGGFAQNQAMRDKFTPGTSTEWTAAGPGDTGEMLLELMDLGAATGQMNERVGNQFCIPPGIENKDGNGLELALTSGQMDIAKPHSIIVDQTGVRYLNEAGSYMTFCQNMVARNETVPAIPSWWVIDHQYMSKYAFCGTLAGTTKPSDWYESGFLKRAESIEDLATLVGLDPQTLRRTVDRFNAGAELGRDDEFGRGNRQYDRWLGDRYHGPSAALGRIDEAPYYAAKVVPGDVGTYGGVVTDANARVLRDDGTVIPGLYATGTTTASVMGRVYPGAGASIGPSFTFGYIAAKHAANAGNQTV